MNHDAMSFFQNISARLSTVRNCTKKPHCRREEEAQPQQPIALPKQSSTPPPLISSVAPPTQSVVNEKAASTPVVLPSRVQPTVSARWSGPEAEVPESAARPRRNRTPCPPVKHRGEKSEEELRQVSSIIMTQAQEPASKSVRTGAVASLVEAYRCVNSIRDTGEPPGERTDDVTNINGSGDNDDGGNTKQARAKLYENAVSEQVRRIQKMPKNTSPVNAKNHASLLPRQLPRFRDKITLILDLDETLVHSSLTSQSRHHDLVLDVRMENTSTTVYVAFRPFMREFLQAVAPLFEVIIFTASVSVYCNQLMDAIDTDNILGSLRLYREHCSILNGAYVKDLSLLGRDLDRVAIIDNSPVAYLFQQRNAIPIPSWFDDPGDNELQQLIPMLEILAAESEVYTVLDQYNAVLHLQQEQARQNSPHY
ncbi:TFIIF-stimulated CTD phosphatase [Trypanosoma brucei equiperdum]|uniref:TFIIF-stimulated CTD phosphatase n=1 Tax=Trypanosoma brucei equiperdum TaxID=630700 RepID=A0A3L6LDN8_9TRYP|nr:TFIIF-stimulated CTD phosphatase [Trypanosoma brucei equiperdum]